MMVTNNFWPHCTETGWVNAESIRRRLVCEGWVTPNTYCNCFGELIDGPAVYLFLSYRRHEYDQAIVSYVGMSRRLEQRIAGHNILPQLDKHDLWTMVWFKRTPVHALRAVERDHIERFDPPMNVIGRTRGIATFMQEAVL